MIRPLLGALLALLPARIAHAYCCIPAAMNVAPVCLPDVSFRPTQAWNQRCIPYYISTQGTLLDGDQRRLLVQESFRVWSANACTDLEFFNAGYTDEAEPGFNPNAPLTQKNIIVEIRRDQLGLLMNPDRLAVTLTTFATDTGEIIDADILINGVNFDFDDVQSPTSCNATPKWDLRNMLVHEMGHLLGFDHTPNQDSTMADMATLCETKKRDLAQFDLDGLCAVYPAGAATNTCAPPPGGYRDLVDSLSRQCDRAMGIDTSGGSGGCGCSSAGAAPPESGALTSLLWVLFLLVGARAARRSRSSEG